MAGRLIISNTTPLINFAEIGRMDLLEELFGGLGIPPVVRAELEAKAAGTFAGHQARAARA